MQASTGSDKQQLAYHEHTTGNVQHDNFVTCVQVIWNASMGTPGSAICGGSCSPDCETASTPLAVAALTAMGAEPRDATADLTARYVAPQHSSAALPGSVQACLYVLKLLHFG